MPHSDTSLLDFGGGNCLKWILQTSIMPNLPLQLQHSVSCIYNTVVLIIT